MKAFGGHVMSLVTWELRCIAMRELSTYRYHSSKLHRKKKQDEDGQFWQRISFQILQGVMEREGAATVSCWMRSCRRQVARRMMGQLFPEFFDKIFPFCFLTCGIVCPWINHFNILPYTMTFKLVTICLIYMVNGPFLWLWYTQQLLNVLQLLLIVSGNHRVKDTFFSLPANKKYPLAFTLSDACVHLTHIYSGLHFCTYCTHTITRLTSHIFHRNRSAWEREQCWEMAHAAAWAHTGAPAYPFSAAPWFVNHW